MDATALKEMLFSVCEDFFSNANLIWAGEVSESPPMPLVTLRVDSMNKAIFPFDEGYNDDGQLVEYYNADLTFEVKGYTQGYIPNPEEGIIQSAENTAMNDIQQFANYLASEGMTIKLSDQNVSMTQIGPVRDTSVVKSGSRYEYSAMVEYKVDFVLEVSGYYAVTQGVNTLNGTDTGIKEELIEDTGYFETVSHIEDTIE